MPALTTASRLQRNPAVLAADMEGEVVMMCPDNGKYLSIGGVGSRIWELLQSPVELGAIVQVLCAEYDVDAAACEADVLSFAGRLIEYGLVEAQ